MLPMPVVPEVSGHFVRFFEEDDYLVRELHAFVDRALREGGQAIVIATPGHRQGLLQALAADAEPSGHEGLLLLDAAATLAELMVDGWPDGARFERVVAPLVSRACAAGGPVHAFGEMVGLLCEQGHFEAALALEGHWNALAARHRFALLCAYPSRLFGSAETLRVFEHVCGAHTHVCPSARLAQADNRAVLLATWEQKAAALEFEVKRRCETERQLREALARLEEASRAKDEFLAMLGHELRNPLSPIVTALELMRLRDGRGTGREQAIIQRQLEHLTRLVDDLLDISKVTRGKIELKKEWLAVADVLTKAVEMASPLLEQRSHRLAVDSADGLRCHGDAMRLAQVVANLLTNAARYTPVGGDIRLSARRADGRTIEIRVQDDGIGIAPEALPKIFDIFFQGQRASGRAEGGLGIGLALVKSFVTLHGGTVGAASDGPGCGSTFTVRLPVAGADAGAADSPPPAEPAVQPAAGAALRVLVVDDNVDAAETLAQLLSAAGHRVEIAHNPAAALMRARSFVPDLALLDIGMPVMDGYELAARLRAQPELAGCRFAALTGYGRDDDKARSEAAGFRAHFVKPVDGAQLLRFASAAASPS
jgi:signal transduction histidine kinase